MFTLNKSKLGGADKIASELIVSLAATVWNGYPEYVLSFDGVDVGKGKITALHSEKKTDRLHLYADWKPGKHQVSVSFTNGAAGGKRNLYVVQVHYNGRDFLARPVILYSTGVYAVTVDG